VSAAMIVIVAAGLALEPQNVALRFWSQAIILEFVAGMWIALLYAKRGIDLHWAVRLGFCAAAVVLYLADPMQLLADAPRMQTTAITPNGFERIIGWGIPSLLVLLAVLGGPLLPKNRLAEAATTLGDASYALYLLHPFAIMAGLTAVRLSGVSGLFGFVLFAVLTFLAAALSSILAYRLFERPLTNWLLGLRTKRDSAKSPGIA